MPKKTLEQEINEFLETWDLTQTRSLLEELEYFYETYNSSDDNEDESTTVVRLIRTAYLISKISDLYAGKLCNIRTKFKGLWLRMENESS